jgi:hypothetical protein
MSAFGGKADIAKATSDEAAHAMKRGGLPEPLANSFNWHFLRRNPIPDYRRPWEPP